MLKEETMSGNIVLEIQRRQTVAAREALETWLTANPGEIHSAALDDLIRLCLGAPARLREAERQAFDGPRGNDRASYDVLEALREVFGEEIRLLESVRHLVLEARSAGQAVDTAADLERAITETVTLRDRLFAHWEPFTAEKARQAREAIARGEHFLDLEDAMAQAAGVDRETWLQKVEERKQPRGSINFNYVRRSG
jgi:hypothetical protein